MKQKREHGGHKKHSHADRDAGKKSEKKTYIGSISVVPKGVGYVPLQGFAQDIEIAPERLNTALHGDQVEIKLVHGKYPRKQGAVVRVIERAKMRYAGVLQRDGMGWILKPDNRRMYRDIEVLPGAKKTEIKEGLKAIVEIKEWEDPLGRPKAVIEEILGPAGAHETEMRAIVAERGFDATFPAAVSKAAEELRARKDEIFAVEIPKRRDMRETLTFTIDPDDAKDFDDAISIKKLADGRVELGVHIADVSAYIQPGDLIDKEAVKRGTSIYLVDRTIPMLPEALSNDLCSLTPGDDKLAFSAIFTMSMEGEIFDSWYGRTVIRSDKRFTYDEAQKVLDTGNGPHAEDLRIADVIATALRKERFAKGAIGFETSEVKFKLDANGTPIEAYLKERKQTSLLIEDLMLLANRKVAEFVSKKCVEMPGGRCAFVYRVHDAPKPERIEELGIFLKAIGHELRGSDSGVIAAKDINDLFEKIQGTPEQNLIETATIRSMAKAVYSVKNIGHFGLSFEYYTHFTSPIRRYPDLMVHRILANHLDGSPIGTREYAEYERLAIQCSEREVAAVEAERDSIKYKQVEYLQHRIGEVFEGVISGVTEWGMYVEEKSIKAEGLVRLRAMKDDWYQLDQKHYRLVGEKTGKKYSLGDSVRVRLTGANLEQKTLDFELA